MLSRAGRRSIERSARSRNRPPAAARREADRTEDTGPPRAVRDREQAEPVDQVGTPSRDWTPGWLRPPGVASSRGSAPSVKALVHLLLAADHGRCSQVRLYGGG